MAKDDAKDAEQTKQGGGLKKILMIVVPVVVLVGGAFAFVQIAVPPAEATEEVAQEKPSDPEADWKRGEHKLSTLYVNLAGTNGKRYLKVGLTFSFFASNTAAQLARFTAEETLIKDGLITLLSGKTLDDIDGAEKKKLLKKELEEVLSKALFEDPEQQGRIETVFYYEFLVQ